MATGWTTRFWRYPAPGGRGAGFTLPEVLATLVLIGIVVPVAMTGISLALAAAAHARNTAQAAALGEAKLMEMVATSQWGAVGTGGTFSPDWPEFRWSAQTVTRDFNTQEILLNVMWTERGVEQALSVSTVMYYSTATEDTTGTGTTGGAQS